MFAHRRDKSRAAMIVATAVGVVAVVGGGSAITWALTHQSPASTQTKATPSASVSVSSSPSPSASPEPEPVDLPYSAPVAGTPDSWWSAPTTEVADASAQVGAAADGESAGYVDAPVLDTERTALSTKITVEAGTTYEFSAQLRQLTSLPAEAAAYILIGDDTRIELPELDAEWQEVTGEFTAPSGMTETELKVQLTGPVTGLGIDDVSLAATGGDNIVQNPSFEQITSDTGILNNALILRQQSATLGVRMAAGDASWKVSRGDGSVVADGTATLRDGVSAVPLDGVPQGYFVASVTDASGATIESTVAVIDYDGARIASDSRIGAITHVDQSWYANSADILQSVGFGAARNDVLWQENETSQGVYDWADQYTSQFDSMHLHGVQLLAIVNYDNTLYDSGNTVSSDAGIAAYAKYATEIAKRFDVMGLEVYNEFNETRFNTSACGTDAACYLPLVQAVKEQVSAVDPDVPVVAGSTANYDGDWFDALWQTGALNYADAMSFHPYDAYDQPLKLSKLIGEANQSMADGVGDAVPIWMTELGWTTGNELNKAVDYDQQAQNLVVAESLSLGLGTAEYFWYDLVDDSTDQNSHEGSFGMFYQKVDNVAVVQPKAAAFAQALLINELGGRAAAGQDDLGDGNYSFSFGQADDAVHVAWTTNDQAEVTYDAAGPITLTDLQGNVQTIQPENGTVTVTLGASPVILSGDFSVVEQTPTPSTDVSPAPTETAAKVEDE